jgi:hypothetical protein
MWCRRLAGILLVFIPLASALGQSAPFHAGIARFSVPAAAPFDVAGTSYSLIFAHPSCNHPHPRSARTRLASTVRRFTGTLRPRSSGSFKPTFNPGGVACG